MHRATYRGVTRNSVAEDERDARMLVLSEQGLAASTIAQRMGVTVTSVRARIKRARTLRGDSLTGDD